jgi:hypothetical protein
MTKEQPSDVDSIQESDQPPISLSATELCSPGGVHETGQSYITPWKAKSLSDKEEKVGWESPEPSKEDASISMDRERRSKNNQDRPSKVLYSPVSAVPAHLEFSDESGSKKKDLVGAELQEGLVGTGAVGLGGKGTPKQGVTGGSGSEECSRSGAHGGTSSGEGHVCRC